MKNADLEKSDVEHMDLKDWKDIEQSAETTMFNARRDIVVAKIMLANAIKHIKRMNGTTNEEIRENARNENHSSSTV